jgi:hypothetical protein
MSDDIMRRILTAILEDYSRQDNPGYSDLDNEQPISIHIHVSLGDLRRLRSSATTVGTRFGALGLTR